MSRGSYSPGEAACRLLALPGVSRLLLRGEALQEANVMKSHVTSRTHTVPEVATLLRVSDRTVKRRVADGSIRSIRLGRLVRVSEKEVARLLDS